MASKALGSRNLRSSDLTAVGAAHTTARWGHDAAQWWDHWCTGGKQSKRWSQNKEQPMAGRSPSGASVGLRRGG